MKNQRRKELLNKKEKAVSIMLVIIIVLTAALLGGSFYLRSREKQNISGTDKEKTYRNHYMLIADNPNDEFWKAVYEGAKTSGESRQTYVENLGDSTEQTFSVEELMEIAVSAKADGIIVEADQSPKLDELINKASEENIPVVTVYEDAPQSKRKSFIGVNEHQLGEIYGSQILEQKKPGEALRVTILSDVKEGDTAPDLVYSGIKGVVSKEDIELTVVRIDRSDSFSSEETIRNLVIDRQKIPDVLVCLNEADTMCAYQSVVDYNAVGKMQIIGFYSSANIIAGIEKGILSSSITVDAEQIGAKAVESLLEYREKVHVNEYETVAPQVITKENAGQYKKDGERYEE